MSSLEDIIDARIAANKISLDDIPLAALKRALTDQLNPDGDTFLLPHSIGLDSLDPLTGFGAAVTALPLNPIDGQRTVFVADVAAAFGGPYLWHLQYYAAGAAGKRWQGVGKQDALRLEVATNETTASAAFVALATAMSITLPLAGDYEFEWGFNGFNSVGASNLQMGLSISAVAPATTEQIQASTPAVNTAESFMRQRVKTGLSLGATIATQYATSGGTGNFRDRWLAVRPIRVG